MDAYIDERMYDVMVVDASSTEIDSSSPRLNLSLYEPSQPYLYPKIKAERFARTAGDS